VGHGGSHVGYFHVVAEAKPSGLYENTIVFGHVKTWSAHWLTGEFAIDPSNASYTGLFDTAHTGNGRPSFAKDSVSIRKNSHRPANPTKSWGLTCPEMVALGLPAGNASRDRRREHGLCLLAAGVWHHNEVCESVGTTNVPDGLRRSTGL
jgi:xylulokinase